MVCRNAWLPRLGGGERGAGGAGAHLNSDEHSDHGPLVFMMWLYAFKSVKRTWKKNVFLTSSNELNMCQVSNMFNLQTVKARARFVIHSTRFRSPNLLSVRQKKKKFGWMCHSAVLQSYLNWSMENKTLLRLASFLNRSVLWQHLDDMLLQRDGARYLFRVKGIHFFSPDFYCFIIN